jgi:hypothetical protein
MAREKVSIVRETGGIVGAELLIVREAGKIVRELLFTVCAALRSFFYK